MTFKPAPPAPQDLTPEEISSIMGQAELISAWISKVRSHAEQILDAGGEIPGWKLVQKRATRKWLDTVLAERALIEDLGIPEIEVLTEPELKSVAQIEKVLKSYDVKINELEHLIVKESSGTTLARADDKRLGIESSVVAFKPQLVAFEG